MLPKYIGTMPSKKGSGNIRNSVKNLRFSCSTQKSSFNGWQLSQMFRYIPIHHNQGELVRSKPSLLVRLNSTKEYWKMFTFEPPHICFSNNST